MQSTIDGENYANHPYIVYQTASPSKSVAQIANPSTVATYVMLAPLTQVRIKVSSVSAGSLKVQYTELNYNFADPTVGGGGGVGSHASSHENAGSDEINVDGLNGVLADDQHVIDSEVDARISAAIGVSVQAWDADLDAWAGYAQPGSTVVGVSASQTLTNKTIDTASNTITVVEADISDLGSYLESVALASDVSGILPVANGGTGASSLNNLIALGTHSTGNYLEDLAAGALIDVSGGGSEGATVTVAVDLSELTDMTGAESGTDELVILDSGVQKRKAIGEINLSNFNDDLGYAAGDITAVTAGTLLDGGGTDGAVTLNVDLSELSTSVADGDGDYFVVVDAANAHKKLTKVNIALSGFNNDSGFLTSVDLTSDVTGDLPVADGGTGASDAATARTNLGVDLAGAATGVHLDSTPASDHTWEAITADFQLGGTVGQFKAVYMVSDGDVEHADADAATTMPVIALSTEAGVATDTDPFVLQGFVRDDSWAWTVGGEIYASTTAGDLTQTKPSGTGDQVQILGYAVTADVIYFNPSPVLIEV